MYLFFYIVVNIFRLSNRKLPVENMNWWMTHIRTVIKSPQTIAVKFTNHNQSVNADSKVSV